jgi:hypothetical protein
MNLADVTATHVRPHPPDTLRHPRRYLGNEVAQVRNDSKKLPDRKHRSRDKKGRRMVQNQGTAKRQYHPVVCRASIKFHTEKFSRHIPFSLKKDFVTTLTITVITEKTRKNLKKN